MHMSLLGRTATLLHIAGGAGADDVFPSGLATHPSRDHMIKGEMLATAAILALEMVAQEERYEAALLAREDYESASWLEIPYGTW